MSLWLIGAGPMAQDYANVLQALEVDFQVVGRGTVSAESFVRSTGKNVRTEGLNKILAQDEVPEAAIVAVGMEQLSDVSKTLVEAGTSRILLEKPGGLDLDQLLRLNEIASKCNCEVSLAYNRRFYSSTLKAEDMILEDGGIQSAQFEFTEWSHVIGDLPKAEGVKEHWLLGNSTHVIDLVFYFCGVPQDWRCWNSGTLDWHPAAARFCGAGVTDRGILFSYLADWEAPGRWGIELLTRCHRFIFRPMEELKILPIGSVMAEKIELNDSLDLSFKPGLYRQTEAFVRGQKERFCSLEKQVEHARLYSEMAGY